MPPKARYVHAILDLNFFFLFSKVPVIFGWDGMPCMNPNCLVTRSDIWNFAISKWIKGTLPDPNNLPFKIKSIEFIIPPHVRSQNHLPY